MKTKNVRTWRLRVQGFDFDVVWVRARTRAKAKFLCALSYNEAGWGTIGDGLKSIESCVLDPSRAHLELCSPNRPEGLLVTERES